ncbi:MAG: hypothetical protein HOP33_21660 [Verrucomicrobia bacterium]|nr:hypothetical protein [Verrucomicrobiota bacterium]
MKTTKSTWLKLLVLCATLAAVLPAYAFYSPAQQRWLNRDPLGEAGGLNQYGFIENNPVDHVDSDGLSILGDFVDWWCSRWPDAAWCGSKYQNPNEIPIIMGMCPSPNFGRGWGKGPGSTGNKFKHMRPDPKDPTKIIWKHPRTGKDISKPKPPDFPGPKAKPANPD